MSNEHVTDTLKTEKNETISSGISTVPPRLEKELGDNKNVQRIPFKYPFDEEVVMWINPFLFSNRLLYCIRDRTHD